MTRLVDRIAAAPITWGVDGSDGWGATIPRERMVAEMKSIGLGRTELGPDGYFPADPDDLDAYLHAEGVSVVGGWVPIPMGFQDLFDSQLAYLRRACAQFQRAGCNVLVLGPVWDLEGYVKPRAFTKDEWSTFMVNLSAVGGISREFGLTTALHQHTGTAIEDASDLQRVIDESDVQLCVDTGHMLCCGIDPVEVVTRWPERVAHVHLKDVRSDLARQISAGDLGFLDAVKDGLFLPLGEGDVDVPAFIQALEDSGYQGWYTIEQDCSLASIPAEGLGPVVDCRTSFEYLKTLAEQRSL